MDLLSIHTKLILPGDDIANIILAELKRLRLKIRNRDIILVTSKIVSVSEGRIAKLENVITSPEARRLGKATDLDERQVQLIIEQADKIYGKVHRAFLTLKDNFLIANAGIDKSNSRNGEVILWPNNPQETANKIQKRIRSRSGKRVGVVIVDSRTTPLRHGTTGLALGVAGFQPVKDYRMKKDIFGNVLRITLQNLADDLASAAHLLMGEADERTPIVLARNVPVEFSSRIKASSAFISPDECLYMKTLNDCCSKSTRHSRQATKTKMSKTYLRRNL